MKKQITLLASLVLSCLMATPVLADGIQSLTEVGSVVTAPEEGQYYVIQGNGQAGQVSWLYDNDGTFAATALSSLETGPESLKYVWTFEVSDEGYAAKNLTTGRYIFIEGTSNGGSIKMQDTPSYFTIDVNGDEVGFKNSSDRYIDMGYSGTSPVTWNGGVAGSRRLCIYEATVENVSDLEAAIARLNTCFGTYEQYLPGYGSQTFDRGTEIGQYNCSDEVYNLFVENLQKAYEILSGEITDITVDEVDAIIKNIEDGYAAIMASVVKLTIADGNYRVVSALVWTNTERVGTGQYDENDEEIFEEITTNPTKAMYATLEGKAMWANIDSTDCRYLWQLTNNAETGLVKMMNIATDGIIATCSQSTQATLTADSQTELLFEYITRTEDGKIVVAMKPSEGGVRAYLHCNGHGGGTGKASNIVGWEASAGASQWILEPVSDEEVQALVDAYAPIKNHELMVSMFQDLISETENAIAQAQDNQYVTTRSAGLITSTSQFSSPFNDPTEGSFDNVLSDDASTYWHSTWQGGNVANHTHYFQVAFAEPIEGNIQCFMRRRGGAANDHITSLGVFGTNDENAVASQTEDGWTNLGSYDLSKNASQGLTVYSNTLELAEGYQYLRFYIDATTNNRGYAHFATFQLYNLTIDGNTQWSQMGDAATAISEALDKAKAVDLDEVGMEDYDALKEALDAFKAVLCDPSELAAAIEANKDVVGLVAIGDAPGFWSEDSDVSSLANIVAVATAYLKSGAYVQSTLDAYTEDIKNGAQDIFASANPVEEGKWYAIKYDTEENFDLHQWSKSPAVNATLGDLYDNYAAPANVEDNALVGFESLEEVSIGQAVRFIGEDIINEMDQIAFRFVAQGDSAYVIQHKSGLYLSGAARSTNLTLGLTPALFNVKAVGYGKVIIEARDLKGQRYYADAPVYLHAQNAGHSLVTWNNDAVSSNSALYIEPIDESDFDEGEDVAEGVNMNVKPNSMIFMCYPTAFSVEDAELYAYQGAISDGEEAHYTFNKIEKAEPGQPVLLVVGDIESFDAEAEDEEPEQITITPTGSSFAPDPLTAGGVHGTYAYQWVDEGTVVVGGGKFGQAGNTLVLAEGKENTDCTRDISANTGYIVYGENILKDASVDSFDLVFTAGKPSVKGDLNGDGKVDIADAVSILNVMADGTDDPAADLNADGKVDIADFVTVLNIMAEQ
ncbi:MAG: hypothetical protein IJ615_04130 [Bacteroidaceae bacterium]|nr:hypothetical protein [Bacteroidaceae bacterium]